MSKKVIVELTEREFECIWMILHNGWGDGEYAGFGGDNIATQNRALEKFNLAFFNIKGGSPPAPFIPSPPKSEWESPDRQYVG